MMRDGLEHVAGRAFAEAQAALADNIVAGVRAEAASPLHWILSKSRQSAAEAMQQIVLVDPTDATTIMRLQNEVRLYTRIVDFLKEAVSAGDQAYRMVSQEDRMDNIDALARERDEELMAGGVGE